MTQLAGLNECYERDGYWIHSVPLLPPELVKAGSKALDAVRDGTYDTGRMPEESPWKPGGDASNKLIKVEQPQLASAVLREVVGYPALGKLALAMTGAEWVQAWWVQMLMKPPTGEQKGAQTGVGWHQDRQYWSCWEEGSELFTAWLALSDVPEAAGAMRFVPGSHRWGFLDQGDFFNQDNQALRRSMKLPEGAEWAEVPVVLPAGGVSFQHCLTFHASGANQAGHVRRSLAIHMRTNRSAPKRESGHLLLKYLDDEEIAPVFRP